MSLGIARELRVGESVQYVAGINFLPDRLKLPGLYIDVSSYTHVVRWASEIQRRPAVERGQRVNRTWGAEEERVPERHDASDLD